MMNMKSELDSMRRTYPNFRLSTLGFRKGCSCGFALYMMGLHRYVSPGYKSLHHQAWQPSGNNAVNPDMEATVHQLAALSDEIAEMTESHLFRGYLYSNKGIMSNWAGGDKNTNSLIARIRRAHNAHLSGQDENPNLWEKLREAMRSLWWMYVKANATERFQEHVQVATKHDPDLTVNVLTAMIDQIGKDKNNLWLCMDDVIGFGLVDTTTKGYADVFEVEMTTAVQHRKVNVKAPDRDWGTE